MAVPSNTASDNRWAAFALLTMVVCAGGCMFVAAAYVTPAILGSSNAFPREGFEKVVEGVVLLGGFAVGVVVALATLAYATRKLVNRETFDRWAAQSQNPEFLPVYRKLGALILRILRPANDAL